MAQVQVVKRPALGSLDEDVSKTPLVAFLVLALAIAATGYAAFAHLKESIRQDKYGDLGAIADLKVSQIVGWLDARRADGAAVAADPVLAEEVRRWLQRGAPRDESGRRIKERLQGLRDAYGYASVVLLDRDNRPIHVAGDARGSAHRDSSQQRGQ